ncbi:transcription-repair coupling factor [Balneolales bacterium ANBcel1]|nr:transcription-repair coupling factor [Balneolales bacterium ANBcel1]
MSLTQIAQIFSKEFPGDDITGKLRPGHTISLRHFVGSTTSLALADTARRHYPMMVITPDTERAQFLKSDMDALGVRSTLYFPPAGRKPYESGRVKDTAVAAQRSDVIDRIRDNGERLAVVTSADALFEKMASSESFAEASITLRKDGRIDPETLTGRLADQQYQAVSFVNEPGEYARRGGIIDIFPFAGEYPIRLEFFGDEIDSIREFDPDSQRSVAFLDHIRLVPNLETLAREDRQSLISFLPESAVVAIVDYPGVVAEISRLYAEAMAIYREQVPGLADSVSGDMAPADSKSSNTTSASAAAAGGRNNRVDAKNSGSYQDTSSVDIEPPEQRYLAPEELVKQLQRHPRMLFGALPADLEPDAEYRLDARPQPDFNSSVKLLRKDLADRSLENIETYILCDNDGQRNRFEELLGEPNRDLRYRMSVDTLHQGFVLPGAGIAVYTDHQIFNRYHRPKTRTRSRRGGISFKELKDLNIGDYVVHVDHGIGKFAGFRKITVRGAEQESVVLRYQDDSTLYVNVSSLHKLQKYSGKDGTAPKITKLGTGEWARKKAKTRKRVKDIARDLITLYAKRKSQKAWAFSPDSTEQTELEASFMYEETPDQASAIDDVKGDMTGETPMDRLVCGDVGFGKTEVAVRAAFKAVLDGKQVAVMVPTTILADQHWKTFRTRMKDFAVNIEVISRFRSKAEQTDILRRTKKGAVDILVGTHRIASKDVAFKDLGLLIVDEEQRFGVSVKEKLKELRASVDVLTLTATPIPRTLQFSLMGARDLSIINTPPPNRQPVLTEIHSFDSRLIRDAIMQEVSRGGQVFFIHNRVLNIEETAEMIRSLVPNIRVQFAHGQMPGSRLEKIILDFYDHKFDVLVSTNIVENGIDIANANTILINQANHFGLSELHQLRGRVGRSNRKAYCYLITPPMESLSLESRRRLLALEEYSDLGSGFNIAMRDLDIRGAGDILGAEQSGFVNEVGFEMYNKILNDAVRELKETEFSDLFADTEYVPERPETTVEFDYSALLPADYVSDNVERLNLYRRLSGAAGKNEINDWRDEVTDRFGPLPEAAVNLVNATHIKQLASRIWLDKVTIRSGRMWLQCPDHDTETGARFYDQGGLQHLMNQLETLRPGKFQLVQKGQAVRFAVQDVPGLKEAQTLLEQLEPATVPAGGASKTAEYT